MATTVEDDYENGVDPGQNAEDQETQLLQKVANEEYKIWKKNSPFLYDLVITHALDWPSLTLQWFPDKDSPPDKDYTVHRLLLGTHTSEEEPNWVGIAQVRLAKLEEGLEAGKYDDTTGEIGGYTDSQPRVQIIQKIPHTGEVNRARYMPQNPGLIATKTVMGDVYVFDCTKHPSEPPKDGACKPDITLRGHTKEGFGLDWNPTSMKQGHVLSASEDTTVCHWDIQAYTKGNSVLEPLRVYRGHTAVVGDVSWHQHQDSLFASVGDDRRLLIWDTRNPDDKKAAHEVANAHEGAINAVAFAPHGENMLITASSDKTIGLWDLRSLRQKLHSFESHADEVLQLAWSPHNETVFASASSDRRVNLWDVSRIGEEQTPDDAEDGPPETLFVHGGHTARPTDIAWSPTSPWHLASAAEDNVLQVWSPNATITAGPQGAAIPIDELE